MLKPVLVLAESLRGEIPDLTFEVLGAGRYLADVMGVPLYALLLGRQAAPLADRLSLADEIVVMDNPQWDPPGEQASAAALLQVRRQTEAGLILLAGSNLTLGVGAVLAARTDLPLVNFCRAARVEEDSLVLTCQWCAGKVFAEVRLSGAQGIVVLMPGAFPPWTDHQPRSAKVTPLAVPGDTPPLTFHRYLDPEPGAVDIAKQPVLVGVGRGLQDRSNLPLAEQLAAALGGAVCGSRPVIDQGWLALSRLVGKSGMTVRPRVYLALGISGAPEHWEGMQNSEYIIAVNTDPRAPIFNSAHYGVVGDALELLPRLLEKVQARKR